MEQNITCIKCGNPDLVEEADFCYNCGFQLNSNFCTNQMCDCNNGDPFSLPETSCFCDLCGSKTVYYEDGLITPQSFNSR